MSNLVLPPAVRAQMQTKADSHAAKALDRALRKHDPDLSLVWIKTNIPEVELPAGAIPGRWHVQQNLGHRGIAPLYYPVIHPDGSYREPDFGVLRSFQERDTHRMPLDELIARANAPSQKQKDKPLVDEQAHDQTLADFKTAKRVAGDGGLTKRKWGKGAKKGVVGS